MSNMRTSYEEAIYRSIYLYCEFSGQYVTDNATYWKIYSLANMIGTMIRIRSAEKSEIDWVNRCYDEVEFIHSSIEKDFIAIAESDGQRAGLGRLVRIDDDNLELGGMYVFEAFRGQGIAREIVKFLLESSLPHQTIYCIPFEPLIPFYSEFGFIPCVSLEKVPKEILTKYSWCNCKYAQSTALLKKTPS